REVVASKRKPAEIATSKATIGGAADRQYEIGAEPEIRRLMRSYILPLATALMPAGCGSPQTPRRSRRSANCKRWSPAAARSQANSACASNLAAAHQAQGLNQCTAASNCASK